MTSTETLYGRSGKFRPSYIDNRRTKCGKKRIKESEGNEKSFVFQQKTHSQLTRI